MGKSMGAIPGATPFVAREGRKPGVERSPGALVEPVPVMTEITREGMTQTFVAFALANGNSSHFLF
jgi:hypothetical protein